MARKLYTGPIVDVSYDIDICEHAAECVRGMPEVYDTSKRPWINMRVVDTDETAEKFREVTRRCPSGALQLHEHYDGDSRQIENTSTFQ